MDGAFLPAGVEDRTGLVAYADFCFGSKPFLLGQVKHCYRFICSLCFDFRQSEITHFISSHASVIFQLRLCDEASSHVQLDQQKDSQF